jgi:hypothetical protein
VEGRLKDIEKLKFEERLNTLEISTAYEGDVSLTNDANKETLLSIRAEARQKEEDMLDRITRLENRNDNATKQVRFKDNEIIPTDKLEEALSDELKEHLEKKERMNNLIITGIPEINPIPENEKDRANAMGLTECVDDSEIVLALMNKLQVKDVSIDSVTRLPDRQAARRGDMQDKPRILQVKFRNSNDKWKVLTKPAIDILRKDKNWDKVYISPDRTVKERAADFALREERRRRERDGETNLVIRNGKVVQRNSTTSATTGYTATRSDGSAAGAIGTHA